MFQCELQKKTVKKVNPETSCRKIPRLDRVKLNRVLISFFTGRFVPLPTVSSSRQRRFAMRRIRIPSRTSPPRTVT